ncbi:MAG TPA: nucleotide disphospho-sugar-binding domain-containing protein [Candidatus Limnocylindrales bacterium]|nr:nucleotide disphospho-sugar-binding domain-containing protein [Candidatus Limnocylindrales bacterium]
MSRVLVVATAGAGGDLQPLVAAALTLRDRGHEVIAIGDRSVRSVLRGVSIAVETLPAKLDLGPRLAGAVRDAMARTEGDLAAAGPIVQERMAGWAREVAGPVAAGVRRHRPALVVTSLFGVEVLALASPPCPWAVINSTFYIGPDPPRPLEADLGPRAIPLLSRYATLLASAHLVLHATDRVFDFGFDRLPPHHRYVGPLGIWEPPGQPSAYLAEPGDPWVLVSISSQLQDDVPIAQAALAALDGRPVRVVLTVGPDHDPEELGPVPPNARVERVVSHAAVLRQGALLVSHAGHGSVMKALWYGRPMVLVPWGRDQPGVAARAAALGVAEVVARGDASGDALAGAIDRALASGAMQSAAAQHAIRLQATDPPVTASVLLETLL